MRVVFALLMVLSLCACTGGSVRNSRADLAMHAGQADRVAMVEHAYRDRFVEVVWVNPPAQMHRIRTQLD